MTRVNVVENMNDTKCKRLRRKVWITYPSAPDREGYLIEDNGGPKVKVRWYSETRVHEQWIPRERLKQR